MLLYRDMISDLKTHSFGQVKVKINLNGNGTLKDLTAGSKRPVEQLTLTDQCTFCDLKIGDTEYRVANLLALREAVSTHFTEEPTAVSKPLIRLTPKTVTNPDTLNRITQVLFKYWREELDAGLDLLDCYWKEGVNTILRAEFYPMGSRTWEAYIGALLNDETKAVVTAGGITFSIYAFVEGRLAIDVSAVDEGGEAAENKAEEEPTITRKYVKANARSLVDSFILHAAQEMPRVEDACWRVDANNVRNFLLTKGKPTEKAVRALLKRVTAAQGSVLIDDKTGIKYILCVAVTER